jgi:hypothetical protein
MWVATLEISPVGSAPARGSTSHLGTDGNMIPLRISRAEVRSSGADWSGNATCLDQRRPERFGSASKAGGGGKDYPPAGRRRRPAIIFDRAGAVFRREFGHPWTWTDLAGHGVPSSAWRRT